MVFIQLTWHQSYNLSNWWISCHYNVPYSGTSNKNSFLCVSAPKIDLPLSMFLLANSFLTLLFLVSTLLAGGTKKVVLEVAILGEEKSYPKSVQSEVDF